MKSSLFITFMTGILAQGALGQNSKALLVGVANYRTETDWGTLASHIDLEILSASLRRQGFAEKDITALKDPTKRELVEALAVLAEQVEPGGAAVFHFSGHGQPVVDVDGDEASGLDQSLVPADANRLPGSTWINDIGEAEAYFGQNHLIDDELSSYLEAIRRNLGPDGQLICILDACHSGSATRAPGRTRGTTNIMLPSPDARHVQSKIVALDESWVDRSDEENELAPMIAFFACASNELNHEYVLKTSTGQQEHVGSLSFAFASALELLQGEQPIWGDVRRKLDQMMADIAPNQTPYSDGDLTLGVFKGIRKPNDHQLRILAIEGDSIFLSGGSIMNIRPGTVLELTDLASSARNSARAEVLSADFLESTARLTHSTDFAPEDLSAVRVGISLPALGGFQARWTCEDCSREDRKLLGRYLDSYPKLIEAKNGETAHLTCRPVNEPAFHWVDGQGNELLTWPDGIATGIAAPEFGTIVQSWSAALELLDLEHLHSNLETRFSISVFQTLEDYNTGNSLTQWNSDTTRTFRLNMSDVLAKGIIKFQIAQSKYSPFSWYYSVFAIDGCQVHPLHDTALPERKLKRQMQHVYAVGIENLEGMDRFIHFKLIACTEPFDFEAYFTQNRDHFDFSESESEGTRGGHQTELHIETFRIQILYESSQL